jgi:predicted GH43/DUF377 family glycosyl hydrolase
MIAIKRLDIKLIADTTKVILKFLNFGSSDRIRPVWEYIAAMDESEAERQLHIIYEDFEHRHFNIKYYLAKHYEKLGEPFNKSDFSETKKLLLGSYFTHEYSVEASVFFNPSIVPFEHDFNSSEGSLSFVMSMRVTGEGHISSIAFLTGVVSLNGRIELQERPKKISTPVVQYSSSNAYNYTAIFDDHISINSRILFPTSIDESNGMEDARFVLFTDNVEQKYIATYTAYDGKKIMPKCIETTDFKTFQITSFTGSAASDKGFALFPQKINGKYAMIGRQGGRCMSIMYSDNLYHWDSYATLQIPQRPWEILQMGNCGSPIKTEYGWLLLTHAVGPLRQYVISLSLLDLQDPSIVIASLDEPLLTPNEDEREGYVPNVLYTCGMMMHNNELIIPYAMSDSAVGFATVLLSDVIAELIGPKPNL